MREFKPKTDHAREAVEAAVQTLAEQALAHTTLIADDSLRTIEAIVAALDRKLTEQVNVDHASRGLPAHGSRAGAACTISSTTPRPTRC